LLLGILLISTPAFGQTTPTDSQTLQALLAEVRQLRKDLQATTAAGQRAQILLYRLQVQEAAVARAQLHLDESRAKLTQAQAGRKQQAAHIKRIEDFLSHDENPAADRKELEDRLPQLKAQLESFDAEEPQLQTNVMEAEDQLRAERAKLGELQELLDRLQKTLESVGQ
jgi:chromosome segregation ATPase